MQQRCLLRAQIKLNEAQERSLKERGCADRVNERIKQRAIALGLNAHGWNVPEITAYLNRHEYTVRQMRRWQGNGHRWIEGSARMW